MPVSERGESLGVWDFGDEMPGALVIRTALAAAFADALDVGGPWRSKSTALAAFNGCKHFLRWFSESGRELSHLRDLTPAAWNAYLIATPASVVTARLSLVKTLLRRTGQLTPATLRAVDVRSKRHEAAVQQSLTKEQAKAVKRTLHRIVADAHRRILNSWQHLEDYRAGVFAEGTLDERLGRILAHVADHLDAPRSAATAHVTGEVQRVIGSRDSMRAMERLFLRGEEAAAVMSLFALHEGWNPGVIMGLTIRDVTRADDGEIDLPTYTVALDKPRRGRQRHMTNNLVETSSRTGAAVLRMTIEMTASTRDLLAARGAPSERLLIHLPMSLNGRGRRGDDTLLISPNPLRGSVTTKQMRALSAQVGLRDENGELVAFNLQMLRRTTVTQTGPQGHTEATNANVYRLKDKQVRAESQPVFEQGLREALAHAEATVLKTAARAATSDLDPETAQKIDDGVLDTPVGSCKDVEHSPLNKGQRCNASFLMCFSCSNAVVVPRQLPRIVYLHHRLDTLRRSLGDSPAWERWMPHWLRITDLLDRHFTDAERAAAFGKATPVDTTLIDAMLNKRYDI
ncbi:hypothetical protein [Actinoplanes sichuanensis]|uniref:Integrase n=1 Tax=Actinoplanes sichuanensis TaxID=512349 RepID=A0ABW4AFX2_9ACTN|nr:hypothetical protein [Actinoplanes sichuanensis]